MENISPSCTFGFSLDPPPETPDTKRSPDEPHDAVFESELFPQDLVASNAQIRYMPLRLPQILHDFPTKHYKYLLEFDGRSESCTTKKHLQDFEYFLDLFEIEHDDVCMRSFSQYLQGHVKRWFKNLQPESISMWEEFSYVFLDFWGEKRSLK